MILLKNKRTAATIGEISREQLDFLIRTLEEEYAEDRDYWINQTTLEYFQGKGADPNLMKLLQGAIGDSDGMEIEWVSDEDIPAS